MRPAALGRKPVPEPLTTSLLLALIGDLNVAFPSNRAAQNANQLADVYRNGLSGLSGDAVREAVRRCIQTEEYFPKVSKIRAIATAYDRERTVTIRALNHDPDECPTCGARVVEHEIMREIGKDAKGQPILEGTGVWRGTLTHDARRHGVYDRSQEDAA